MVRCHCSNRISLTASVCSHANGWREKLDLYGDLPELMTDSRPTSRNMLPRSHARGHIRHFALDLVDQ